MDRSIPLAALALSLSGCTHLGTNISGDFSCRPPKADCQPLSEVDAKAVRELVKTEASDAADPRQRISVSAADTARTGERTLKIVFPAHVDASGTLHEQSAAWTVVEAARWAGELRGGNAAEAKGTIRALRQGLKDQARRAADPVRKGDAQASLQPLPPEDSAPVVTSDPFTPSSPPVLPSPGGEAQADAAMPVQAASAAEGSDMSPTPHVRAPRPLEEIRHIWPSAAAIETAKALKAKAEVAPNKEPK
ncbi:conjugal transfer protein TraV [Novosphingobium sp. B 225]|uniref:conjugal transfer protein TraV n=1 Tax=Novosphingobium sp. B 225 TaxID=1961849 RepID=UPI0020CE09DB|nr:conjugal transfer protein TraV [Novosphingobium sp. B 225]